jgi:glycerophosphoryl diester phosphodiesterase
MHLPKFLRHVAGSMAASWRTLVAANLLFKLFAFIVLTPLFSLLFSSLLAISGQSVLSDIDIAMFFIGPFGGVCAILLGAVWLSIAALEQASMLAILAAKSKGQTLGVIKSLRFAAGHGLNVLRVTARVIGWSLLVVAPFLLLAAGIYNWLLGDYDINYYLNERPLAFTTAAILGGALSLILLGILLRLYCGWILTLPLILFEHVPPSKGLRISQKRVKGHRYKVLMWLVTWLIVVVALHFLLTAFVGFTGRFLIPAKANSLVILATQVGLMLLILLTTNLLLNLFATIGFACFLYHGYQQIDPKSDLRLVRTILDDDQTPVFVFTRLRLTAVGILGVLVAACVGYGTLQTMQFEDDVQIMAHRGSSKAAPENSMAAFREAIASGADWIELDVQETVDGEIVVFHDSDFMKMAGNPLKLWNAKLEDLRGIDIGSRFAPEFSGERPPTLTEVLVLCKDKIGVNIELKYYGHDQQLEKRVVEIVESTEMADQIMVMSLKPKGLAKMKALKPEWKFGLLLSVYVGKMQDIQADFLAVNSRFATRDFVKRAHASGRQVYVWTVNDAATMSQMMNRNVDGILTDRPELARQVLQQRSEMNSVERLLTELSIFLDRPEYPQLP